MTKAWVMGRRDICWDLTGNEVIKFVSICDEDRKSLFKYF